MAESYTNINNDDGEEGEVRRGRNKEYDIKNNKKKDKIRKDNVSCCYVNSRVFNNNARNVLDAPIGTIFGNVADDGFVAMAWSNNSFTLLFLFYLLHWMSYIH